MVSKYFLFILFKLQTLAYMSKVPTATALTMSGTTIGDNSLQYNYNYLL